MIMVFSESWWYLLIAIAFGVLGTTSMKLSYGLKKWKPSVCLILFYLISFAALTLALEGIDISIVYAIWSGIGTVFVAIIGYFVFEEKISVKKCLSLLLIVLGVFGIHLTNAFR
jgi:small multidrug resistance pump